MQDMADELELFSSSALHLFGSGFETKTKGRSESLKILEKSMYPPPPEKRQFFSAELPHALAPKEAVAVPTEVATEARTTRA